MSRVAANDVRPAAVAGGAVVLLLLAADALVLSGFLPQALSGVGGRLSRLHLERGLAWFFGTPLTYWSPLLACLLAGSERLRRLVAAGALLAVQAIAYLWLDGMATRAVRVEALQAMQGVIPDEVAALTLGSALRALTQGGAAGLDARAWLAQGLVLLLSSLTALAPLALPGSARLGWGLTLGLGAGARLAVSLLPLALTFRPWAWVVTTLALVPIGASLLLASRLTRDDAASSGRTFARLGGLAALAVLLSAGTSLVLPPADPMANARHPPSLADARGRPFDLTDLRGRVVVVTAWSPSCRPCARELEWFADLRLREPRWDLGLVVVAVQAAPDGGPLTLRALPPGAIVTVPADPAEALPAALPATWVLDRAGRVQHCSSGFNDDKAGQLEASIRSLLAQR